MEIEISNTIIAVARFQNGVVCSWDSRQSRYSASRDAYDMDNDAIKWKMLNQKCYMFYAGGKSRCESIVQQLQNMPNTTTVHDYANRAKEILKPKDEVELIFAGYENETTHPIYHVFEGSVSTVDFYQAAGSGRDAMMHGFVKPNASYQEARIAAIKMVNFAIKNHPNTCEGTRRVLVIIGESIRGPEVILEGEEMYIPNEEAIPMKFRFD